MKDGTTQRADDLLTICFCSSLNKPECLTIERLQPE